MMENLIPKGGIVIITRLEFDATIKAVVEAEKANFIKGLHTGAEAGPLVKRLVSEHSLMKMFLNQAVVVGINRLESDIQFNKEFNNIKDYLLETNEYILNKAGTQISIANKRTRDIYNIMETY